MYTGLQLGVLGRIQQVLPYQEVHYLPILPLSTDQLFPTTVQMISGG